MLKEDAPGCRRLSTLSGLSKPVLFILMRDSREPTHANASDEAAPLSLAESAPRVLASRIRAARRALGVSQSALAEAMRVRGFNWRQTTVAKSEAGDRPILFAEVVALTQIFKRGFEYFMFEGTELDSIVDEARRTARDLAVAMDELEVQFNAINNDLDLNYCIADMGGAISKYKKTGDHQALATDVVSCFSRWHSTCVFGMEEVYESVGVDYRLITDADRAALIYIAEKEQAQVEGLTEEQLQYESGERLNALSDFLEGKEVSDAFTETLRTGHQYTSFMAGAVLKILQMEVTVGEID
jgi:transcriptional regulator with XRE-family HTH domain